MLWLSAQMCTDVCVYNIQETFNNILKLHSSCDFLVLGLSPMGVSILRMAGTGGPSFLQDMLYLCVPNALCWRAGPMPFLI